ncbi:dethiobiotin synthase [Intrasporangium oryzae NRRL B-24470]|uniref:ATP-dependent dethiobiotin synthetase BioD n=1 Tax=Intrasporangium oryzae NRRL B-24470 TaxID=1386089 RepID=W9GA43_9MICO|nr:dethiobiotin synthase [Intrasporangium oryzae]EWT00744.1 dethiobiotin synthase [Intrasporangium oryzae NRRL B-24470]
MSSLPRTGGTLPGVIVVTGTDTDVGKTVATAAIAALLVGAGRSVAAYKPTQTGVAPGAPGDMAEVARLAAADVAEGVRLLEPMAPRPAAALEDEPLPTLSEHAAAIAALARTHDHVLVEGAGGLLVELTGRGETLADLAMALPGSGAVVVTRAALGTLNHTMLTREAVSHRGIDQLGVIIGSWPSDPGPVETTNREYLADLSEGLLGAIPAGAPGLLPDVFRAEAPGWLPGLARLLSPQRLGTP